MLLDLARWEDNMGNRRMMVHALVLQANDKGQPTDRQTISKEVDVTAGTSSQSTSTTASKKSNTPKPTECPKRVSILVQFVVRGF